MMMAALMFSGECKLGDRYVPTSWSEDIWQRVTQAAPKGKNGERFRLSIHGLVLVMQNTALDVVDDPAGNYPRHSLQATIRRWHEDETLHRIICVFEDVGLSKDWPSTLSPNALTHGHIGLRDLIISTLLRIRNLPLPEKRSNLLTRSDEDWQRVFIALQELKDCEHSRLALSNLDAFMRDPECHWSDLEEPNGIRINSTVNNWERRGLLAGIVRKLTYQGLTSLWVDALIPTGVKAKRSPIRNKIVGYLRKARKLAAARERRKQQTLSTKSYTWKSNAKSTKPKPKRPANAMKGAIAHSVVTNHIPLPEPQNSFVPLQLTEAEMEVWRARRALRKSKATVSVPISRREKEGLKKKQRPSR